MENYDNITTFDPEELGGRVAILLDDRCDRATPQEVAQATAQAKWELRVRHGTDKLEKETAGKKQQPAGWTGESN